MALPPALLLAGLLTACAPNSPQAQRLPQVRSAEVSARSFSRTVAGIATLEALQEVSLAAQAGGRIERLLVRQVRWLALQ